jgi:protein-arginine kinase activator protein McsA
VLNGFLFTSQNKGNYMDEKIISSLAASKLSSMRKKSLKKCDHCGVEFSGLKTQRFCCQKCRHAFRNAARAKQKSHAKDVDG